jgi:alginate O-acetyltransferase complex protein AlgJ
MAGDLTGAQVASVYRQVLGREASEAEIAGQLAGAPTLDAMLRIALDSEEYAERLKERDAAAQPAVVNVFHPDLAPWSLPPGTRSEDGVAIVGHEGWLFLCGGTNANLGQYVGAVEMEPAWLDEWRQVIGRRTAEAQELGIASALLVVPDKLAVYEEHYPEDLTRVGQRPIERLLAVPGLPIVYPLAVLRDAAAAGDEVYLRTDTHLTFRGNELLFSSVRDALGIEGPLDLGDLPTHSYLISGDLGAKFEPEIVSIVSEPGSLHRATIVEDNRAEIEAVAGHIGTRRVFRNEESPDPRVAVVFGDSFGFAAAYYQGLSWFLAQAFREVHFVWVPFGWDPDYVRRVGAEAVLIQGAERFVARVPHVSADVSRLAEETLRRKRPIALESVFD